MQRPNDVIFVTGADAVFARNLHQLFQAVKRHGWNQGARWIAYDLGMTSQQRARLEKRFDWVEFRTLDLSELPAHYVPSFGAYAWKAQVVWDVVQNNDGLVFWMDSANLPKDNMTPMVDWVRTHGFYMLRGQTSLLGRCDIRMLEKLNMPRWIWGSRELASGLVGVDTSRPELRDIIEEWARLSEDEDIIRPPGDTFEGHRNDQSVLNALVQPLSSTGQIKLPELDIDISAGRPTKFISTRNKLRADFPEWADPFARAYYAIWKEVDQFLIRADKWLGKRWFPSRWLGEYFEVRLSRVGQSEQEVIPCPLGHYYADPFLWEENGARWLFLEDFHYLSMRGTIVAMPLDGDRKAVPVLDPGVHASFPFLFRHDGRLWMLPETCVNGCVDLYECTSFPSGWRKHRSIMEDVNAADSVIFEHAGRWWLITSLQSPQSGGSHRYLAVFHTDDPIDGNWQAHPVNAEGREITSEHGTGRNAGRVFEWQGQLIRCVQSSRDYYGQGMEYRRMTLTPDQFDEEVIETPPHLIMTDAEGVHHMSRLDDWIVWDRRTRH
ncbi:DUF1647 domain-containing protein [Shimia sp.]|uniref:glucosamine inositolphosphorylceramide transferase family protein n=1 Tax=Shimia sp. TaxID=1954381 RepID=UPI003297FC3D